MDDLIFDSHAEDEMSHDNVSEDDVYVVVGDMMRRSSRRTPLLGTCACWTTGA